MNENTYSQDWNLLRLLRLLRRRFRIIAAAAVLAGAVFLCAAALFVTPLYESQAVFYVNNAEPDGASGITSSQLTAAQGLVDTCIAILESRTTLEEIIRQAGVSYDSGTLSGMLTAASVNGTEVFAVTAASPDPQEAARIANAAAAVLPGRIAALVEGGDLRVVDYAVVSDSPASPNYVLAAVIGVFAGLAASVLVLVVLDTLKPAAPRERTAEAANV